jgi:hypothetical protein
VTVREFIAFRHVACIVRFLLHPIVDLAFVLRHRRYGMLILIESFIGLAYNRAHPFLLDRSFDLCVFLKQVGRR